MTRVAVASSPGWGPEELRTRVRAAVGLLLTDEDAAALTAGLVGADRQPGIVVTGVDVVTGLRRRELVSAERLASVTLL